MLQFWQSHPRNSPVMWLWSRTAASDALPEFRRITRWQMAQ